MRYNDERLTLADINWLTDTPKVEFVGVVAYESTASASVGFPTEEAAAEWLRNGEGSKFGQGSINIGALRFKGIVRRIRVETVQMTQDWTEGDWPKAGGTA